MRERETDRGTRVEGPLDLVFSLSSSNVVVRVEQGQSESLPLGRRELDELEEAIQETRSRMGWTEPT